MIWYDKSIGHKDVPEAVGIMYINCGNGIGFLLKNQNIENFITPFVKNMIFQPVGLSWMIKSNQKLNFYIQLHCLYWVINIPWYNTMICSRLHGILFEDYVTTANVKDVI